MSVLMINDIDAGLGRFGKIVKIPDNLKLCCDLFPIIYKMTLTEFLALCLGETQMTVNNQIVVGTLMNLADNPTRVSVGQDWRDADTVNRVPLIVTGNDFSRLYAPLIREGRMEKFYW